MLTYKDQRAIKPIAAYLKALRELFSGDVMCFFNLFCKSIVLSKYFFSELILFIQQHHKPTINPNIPTSTTHQTADCMVGGDYEAWVGGLYCYQQPFWYTHATKPRFDPQSCNVPLTCDDRYTNWASNEPGLASSRCIEMRQDGRWSNENCTVPLCSICQKSASSSI